MITFGSSAFLRLIGGALGGSMDAHEGGPDGLFRLVHGRKASLHHSTEGRTTIRRVSPNMRNQEGAGELLASGPMKPRYLRAGFRRYATIRDEAGPRRMMRSRECERRGRWLRHWAMSSIVHGASDGIGVGRGMTREVVVEIGLCMQRILMNGKRRLEESACVDTLARP